MVCHFMQGKVQEMLDPIFLRKREKENNVNLSSAAN